MGTTSLAWMNHHNSLVQRFSSRTYCDVYLPLNEENVVIMISIDFVSSCIFVNRELLNLVRPAVSTPIEATQKCDSKY